MGGKGPTEPTRSDTVATLVIVMTVAIAGALSPAWPVGVRPADAFWAAGLAGLVALAGSRARAGALLWLAAVTALVSVRGDTPAVVLGMAALIGAVCLVAAGRRAPAVGSAIAGLAVLALLWGPSYGFTGLPSIVAVVAIAPVLWMAWLSLGSRGQRRTVVTGLAIGALLVVGSVMAGLAALSVRSQLTDAAAEARDGLAFARDGQVADATSVLESSSGHFRQSSDTLDGLFALPGRVVPVVGVQVETLRRVSAAGGELAASAADATRRADYESLRTQGGRIDLLELATMQEPVHASLNAALGARGVVADVRSPWLMAPLDHKLDELDDEFDEALPSVELAARALDLVPGLLGRDGVQRYLLQFATPGESRAAGGYVGSYAVLVASGGQLALDLTGSTEDVNVPLDQPPRTFDPPPGWDELYSTFHVGRFPGNVTADPSWPTDSDVARQIYGQVPGVGDVAGTLYADPTAMAAILQLTGAVYVPSLGLTLDASSVEHYLLIDQYVAFEDDNAGRRAVLGDVTRAVFDALTTRKLGGLGEMIDALGKAVDGGHLKLSVFDPEGEALLDELGLSGVWAPTPGADYLSLRSTDLLSNKMDTFIQRSMAVDVTHDPTTGAVRSTVTITMTNTAPPSGLPWYIIGNYEDLPGGTGRDDVALYSPQGLDGATLDGQPIGMLKNRYADGSVYSFPVQIASGQTRTLSVTLSGSVPAGLPYSLDLLPQPRFTPDQVTVTASTPSAEPGPSTVFAGPLTRQELVVVSG